MKYDLLLTGGDVLDPAGGLRGLMDIGIAGGKISAVAPSLPAADARRTISAKGRLVTPGLVDIHAHIFVNASDMAGHTDHFCRASGVTTLCDAGSTGSATFPGLRQVIDRGGCAGKAPITRGASAASITTRHFATSSAALRWSPRVSVLPTKGTERG